MIFGGGEDTGAVRTPLRPSKPISLRQRERPDAPFRAPQKITRKGLRTLHTRLPAQARRSNDIVVTPGVDSLLVLNGSVVHRGRTTNEVTKRSALYTAVDRDVLQSERFFSDDVHLSDQVLMDKLGILYICAFGLEG
jgi:hypothetical protein